MVFEKMKKSEKLILSEYSHRRLNILTGEWLLVSPHRAKRPWQGKIEKVPPAELSQYDPSCYLCPGNKRAGGALNPKYDSTYVFTNDFSALMSDVSAGEVSIGGLLQARSERGICRVICFSPRHDLSLPEMDIAAIRNVIDVWTKEYRLLGAMPNINYVQIFENKGELMGCSNPHPHCQIWAENSVPIEPAKETNNLKSYLDSKKCCLLCDYLELELKLKERIVCENKHFVVLVPFWAIWPFETMVLPKRHCSSLLELSDKEKDSFADMIKRLTIRYDNLFEISFPYSAGIHQAPTDSFAHPEWHLHSHFYPPLLRSATVRKFLVGFEMLANPQRDITAELSAERLRSLSEIHYKHKNRNEKNMKKNHSILACVITGLTLFTSSAQSEGNKNYISNREPLVLNPYVQLPLGNIKAKGWLLEQLQLSAKGMTGQLDEIWKDVGPSNGWLGGLGDAWERGPYWLDGLLPLAYTLGDKDLINKTQKWIDWTLTHQREDGYFGPILDSARKFTPAERVLAWQEKNKEDWWPHMVMLKVMEQYYDATGDARVLNFMTKYFQYQLKHLPNKPLDHWTHWAKERGGENLASIYWLYNRTGDSFLLDLAKIVFQQTDDITGACEAGEPKYLHGVNTGMQIKQPAVYYQQSKDERYLKAVKKGINDLMKYHGQIEGVFSGDEILHGTNPTQGTEYCTIIEYMFSLETVLRISGDVEYADMLERVTFNAVPTQTKPDYTGRQYYQLPNQVVCDTVWKNFNTYYKDATLFGLETGYGCCTANYHQGWPKFTANLWFASKDNGLAALYYSPCEVTAKVADNVEVKITEETNYPFDETINFIINPEKKAEFPLHFRIPSWCKNASVLVNGSEFGKPVAGTIVKVSRQWKSGDKVTLIFPMEIKLSRWHEESVGVERGPLVYALRIREDWQKVKDQGRYSTYAVYPLDPWNYGLIIKDFEKPDSSFQVQKNKEVPLQPWTLEAAPIIIKAKAKRIPEWQMYKGIAGPLPWSPIRSKEAEEEIVLIPYGCTKLRISEFPFIE